MKKEFLFGPTFQHCLRYCEMKGLNPSNYIILDTSNPWYIIEGRLAIEVEQHHVRILDCDYGKYDALRFNDIMSYLEQSDDFTMEIVENVYFN